MPNKCCSLTFSSSFCKFLAKSVVYSNKLKKIEKKMEHVSRILNKSKAFGTEHLFIFNWTSRHLLWWSKLFAQVQTVAVNRQRVIFLIRLFFLLQLRRKSCLRPPARCYQNIKRHKNIFFSFFFSFFHLSFLKNNNSLCWWSMKGLVLSLFYLTWGISPIVAQIPFDLNTNKRMTCIVIIYTFRLKLNQHIHYIYVWMKLHKSN